MFRFRVCVSITDSQFWYSPSNATNVSFLEVFTRCGPSKGLLNHRRMNDYLQAGAALLTLENSLPSMITLSVKDYWQIEAAY